MSSYFGGDFGTQGGGNMVTRGPYRNLRNDPVYMSLIESHKPHNIISASEYLTARKAEEVTQPNISKSEMRKMVQEYNEQMIYLKGGVKAALDHGIDVESVEIVRDTAYHERKAELKASAADKERHVRFGDALANVNIGTGNSCFECNSLLESVDPDFAELAEEMDLLARQPGSKDSEFYRATDECLESGFHDHDNRATPRANDNSEDDEDMHYTMSPPTPPEACLDGVQRALRDALDVNQAIEDQLAQNKVSGLATAFESQSVEKSRSAKDDLSMDDFEDNLPIQQTFSEVAVMSVVRSEKNTENALETEELSNDDSIGAYCIPENDVERENQQFTYIGEVSPHMSPEDSEKRARREILSAIQSGVAQTTPAPRKTRDHDFNKSSPQKRAICGAVQPRYGIKPGATGPQVEAPWVSSPKVLRSLSNSAETIKKTLTRRQNYVERIRREASAMKARKRAEERDIRRKLGLEE